MSTYSEMRKNPVAVLRMSTYLIRILSRLHMASSVPERLVNCDNLVRTFYELKNYLHFPNPFEGKTLKIYFMIYEKIPDSITLP